MSKVDLSAVIPNNVGLKDDRRLMRALEQWRPAYIDWWKSMGPEGFQEDDVYLRTAISVDREGWANFDYVKMPDYRWGIFLSDPVEDRKVGFGDHYGEDAWQTVPGEYRGVLRRLIVTQGDTEPASVEQQRMLGQTAPSLYDCRNLFQVNVEEGRHLWAMVYLLHTYFGRDGREEAEDLLRRRSGDPDSPRILGAFNEPIADWLSFYMFTTFTDRDGKFQLLALAESGFDPLSRTCRFMLPEYAELQEMFASAYLAAQTDEEKENIKRLAWYSTEFGMIMEDGVMKVFGTGLMSGGDEFTNAAEGKLEYEEFTLDNVLGKDKVMYEQHDHLYVIESLEQCKAEIAQYFDPIVARGPGGAITETGE